ncbi:response regulator [Pseudoduganella sp. FT93W]|uniref:Response regulator n=1 Tax=Duganella fentianensis TaxID=2692177 RepID=A0A845I251_9BURK|nr:response regulator transcription factor [Duganella fentianensis]MYN47644.1 response regulator [Duganella fentianensis]
MNEPIKVLLVEDDPDLRDSVVEWMEIHGTPVTAVRNAAEFYQALSHQQFHVAVIDVGLPDQEGYVLAEYTRANTRMGIIILTARSTLDDKLRGYQSGADIFMVKPVDCRELAAVVHSMGARVTSAAPAEATAVAAVAPTEHWHMSATLWELRLGDSAAIKLSQKELQLMEMLAAQPGAAVQKRIILTRLYQRDDYSSSRSLDTLVRRLRAKIVARLGTELPLRTVHAVGYCFAAEISMEDVEPV